MIIKTILDEFTIFIGLQVNGAKSNVLFSKRVQDGKDLAARSGFQVAHIPIKYLGAPLTGKSISHRNCTSLISNL